LLLLIDQFHLIESAEFVVVGLLIARIDVLAREPKLAKDTHSISGFFLELPHQTFFGSLVIFQPPTWQCREITDRNDKDSAQLAECNPIGTGPIVIDLLRNKLAKLKLNWITNHRFDLLRQVFPGGYAGS